MFLVVALILAILAAAKCRGRGLTSNDGLGDRRGVRPDIGLPPGMRRGPQSPSLMLSVIERLRCADVLVP